MEQIRFGRTGRNISTVSLGAWSFGSANHSADGYPIGWAGQEEQDSLDVLKHSWEHGINHWDTADVYGSGRSETVIGKVWSIIPRNNIFLATKVGWDKGEYDHYYHPKLIVRKLEKSLKNLSTDFIDLYYFHHCQFGESEALVDDAIALMHHFRDEGKIRFIGLSDWKMTLIMKFIDRVNPDVIQPYRNVMDDDYKSSGLKTWVEKNDIGIAYFSPIKHGLLTGKYSKPPSFEEGDFRLSVKEFQDENLIKKLQENRILLENRFKEHLQPVLHGLIDALLTDSPTGCVLVGQRNKGQSAAAAELGTALSAKDANWVKELYSTLT
jgi:aryl-alcohol dehydrogenase-like predicted oxidoreductase